MKFEVSGKRDGTEFTAPVEAESADTAANEFLGSVEDATEFEINEVTKWVRR